jgi:hypothetical protein
MADEIRATSPKFGEAQDAGSEIEADVKQRTQSNLRYRHEKSNLKASTGQQVSPKNRK